MLRDKIEVLIKGAMVMKEIEIMCKSLEKLCMEDRRLFKEKVSEQAICAMLSQKIYTTINHDYPELGKYYVDVEYNRGYLGRRKVMKAADVDGKIIYLKNIVCDLVVHNRGEQTISPENLIAIEMKKTTDCLKTVTNEDEKKTFKNKRQADRMRLIALTSNNENVDGYSMYHYPKKDEISDREFDYVVEGFQLGVFIELCDKHFKSRRVPKGWTLDCINAMKISFFVNGYEVPDQNYKIRFTDNSFKIEKIKILKNRL